MDKFHVKVIFKLWKRSARKNGLNKVTKVYLLFTVIIQHVTASDVNMSKLTTTSFPGSLFSASLSSWSRDPGCDWSRDHLSIQNRRVEGYSSTFGREENPVTPSFQQIFLPADSGWSRDHSQRGSLFQRLRGAEKRDPGNEVDRFFPTHTSSGKLFLAHASKYLIT